MLFANLNHPFSHWFKITFAIISMQSLLTCISCIQLHKEMGWPLKERYLMCKETSWKLKRFTWNNFCIGFCWIPEHLNIFIESCAQIDHFPAIKWALYDIREFMLWKKQYYAQRISSRAVGVSHFFL